MGALSLEVVGGGMGGFLFISILSMSLPPHFAGRVVDGKGIGGGLASGDDSIIIAVLMLRAVGGEFMWVVRRGGGGSGCWLLRQNLPLAVPTVGGHQVVLPLPHCIAPPSHLGHYVLRGHYAHARGQVAGCWGEAPRARCWGGGEAPRGLLSRKPVACVQGRGTGMSQ